MSHAPGSSEDPILRLSSLTRDLAHLQYERSQAEKAGDTDEARSIADTINQTKQEIASLTAHPEVREQFEQYRQHQFNLVESVHDLQRIVDRIRNSEEEEHRLARKHSVRASSSHAKNKLQSLRAERTTRQQEIDTTLSQDPELALAWRSSQLREYRRQFQKNHFVETPSRRALISRLLDLWADEKKVLLTGPTGTGKTELVKHAAREYSGDPEIISGHQGFTTYEVYGKPALTTVEGNPQSTFTLGKLPRAAKDGHICIYDEMDLVPTQTLLRHKADFNLRIGDSLSIQEDSSQHVPIHSGFGIAATANIKSQKHKERESLDPALTRLFEPLPVSFFPKEELYDLALSTLIDRRGYLHLSLADARDTLRHLVDAASDIQDAYLGRATSFYEKGGRSTGKTATLDKAILDPGRLLALLSGWKRAALRGQTFKAFLENELTHFINNEDYTPKERFILLDILTSHGFLHDQSISAFLPSQLTPEEWQRHLAAHPQSIPKTPPIDLDPLTVAALDPYHQRSTSVTDAAEAFLGGEHTPPQSPPNTIDTTNLERTLNLSSQYHSQLQILRDSAILTSLQSGQEGITGIDGNVYPIPILADIRSALSSKPHLQEKIAQGFTRLLIVPFGMSLDILRECYKQTLLDTDQSTGLKDGQGNPQTLDRDNPLFAWDKYQGADQNGTLVYDPQMFSKKHNGKTKSDLLSSGLAPRSLGEGGWQVLLVEDITDLPRENQGKTVANRKQLECNQTPTQYRETLHTDLTYQHEVGLTPESYVTYAITTLRENGTVLDRGTLSFLIGAYFPSAGNVPRGYFSSGNHRAYLDGLVPDLRNVFGAARSAVRVL